MKVMTMNNISRSKIELFTDKVILTNNVRKSLQSIRDTHSMTGIEGVGMLLLGDSGLGKTTILDKYIKDNLKIEENDELTCINIIKVSIPSKPTIKSLITSILEEVNYPIIAGTESQLTTSLNNCIKKQKIELIIFDEFQHFLREQAQASTRNVTNFIKLIMDKHKLSMVMAGLKSGKEAISSYEELYQRFTFEQVILSPYSLRNEKEIEVFRNYMISIERIIKDLEISIIGLSHDEMLQKVIIATQGVPRLINRLFTKLLTNLKSNHEINIDDFINAYYKIKTNKNYSESFNPFNINSKKKLIELSRWNVD